MTDEALTHTAVRGTILAHGIDYVAVASIGGKRGERPCSSFEEAHALVMAAKARGAEEAYVDERPCRDEAHGG